MFRARVRTKAGGWLKVHDLDNPETEWYLTRRIKPLFKLIQISKCPSLTRWIFNACHFHDNHEIQLCDSHEIRRHHANTKETR